MVRLPDAAFHSTRDVGAFVSQLLGPEPLASPYAVAKVRNCLGRPAVPAQEELLVAV